MKVKHVNWEQLIDVQALAALLPAEYEHFARPVKEGLVVFLNGLPTEIQNEVFVQQASLPIGAKFSQRLGALARACPVLHKLGQTLARDRRLALELRRELQALESLPPSVTFADIEAILARELGPLERRGVHLRPPAIAEASVAVVIPFEDENRRLPHGGVFKILKPGIEERLELELSLLADVGAHMDERCWELSIPQLDYRDAFEQVRSKLRNEVELHREQQHLVEARAQFADDPEVQIPLVLEHSTPRVTAMERIVGEKITEHPLTSGAERIELASLVTRALVAEPMFSRSHRAMFHSDPHAGNLLYTQDGRLAILDWSLVGHLSEADRVAMGQLALAALSFDATRIVAILESLSERRQANVAMLRQITDNWLRSVRRGHPPGLTWIIGLLDEAHRLARLRVGPDLMLLRKSLLTLEGVVGELGADGFRMDDVLLAEFAIRFGSEWPSRWFSLPTSRSFATRLSNLDLASTLWGMPLAAARFWQAEWIDWCKSFQLQRSTP